MGRAKHRNPDRCPTHPGAFLRETILPAVPTSKVEIAAALGISRQSLYDILSEKQPVSPGMAVRLGVVFGTSSASWLKMQVAYDFGTPSATSTPRSCSRCPRQANPYSAAAASVMPAEGGQPESRYPGPQSPRAHLAAPGSRIFRLPQNSGMTTAAPFMPAEREAHEPGPRAANKSTSSR